MIGSHETKWSVIQSYLGQTRGVIRPIGSSYLSKDGFIIYLHKNNKLLSFSNKLNKIVKLTPCDATLRRRSKKRRAKILMTSLCANNVSLNFWRSHIVQPCYGRRICIRGVKFLSLYERTRHFSDFMVLSLRLQFRLRVCRQVLGFMWWYG